MNSTSFRPIAGVPPSAWAAIRELPEVCQEAFLVRPDPLGGMVAVQPILVTRINREAGYVVWRGRGRHLQRFDIDRIAEFSDVHSTLGRAMGRCVELLKGICAEKASDELQS
jgi:hypothetical protein